MVPALDGERKDDDEQDKAGSSIVVQLPVRRRGPQTAVDDRLAGRLRGLAPAALMLAIAATAVACTRLDLSALRVTALGWVVTVLALNSASMLLRAFAWLGALPGTAHVRRWSRAGDDDRSARLRARAGRACEPVRTWLVSHHLPQRNALALVVGTLLSQMVLNLRLVALSALALPGALSWHGRILVLAWPLALVVVIIIATRIAWPLRAPGRGARDGLAIFPSRAVERRSPGCSSAPRVCDARRVRAAPALHLRVDAPLATAAAILVAVNVTAAVPVTPSNIGVFPAACIGVLAGAGVASGLGLWYGLLLQGHGARHRACARAAGRGPSSSPRAAQCLPASGRSTARSPCQVDHVDLLNLGMATSSETCSNVTSSGIPIRSSAFAQPTTFVVMRTPSSSSTTAMLYGTSSAKAGSYTWCMSAKL